MTVKTDIEYIAGGGPDSISLTSTLSGETVYSIPKAFGPFPEPGEYVRHWSFIAPDRLLLSPPSRGVSSIIYTLDSVRAGANLLSVSQNRDCK